MIVTIWLVSVVLMLPFVLANIDPIVDEYWDRAPVRMRVRLVFSMTMFLLIMTAPVTLPALFIVGRRR